MARWHSNDEAQVQARNRKRQLTRLYCMFDTFRHIKQIEPKLHYIRLSGDYTYLELDNKIGPMRRIEKSESRMPIYQTQTVCHLDGLQLTAFTGRTKGFFPRCRLEFTLPGMPPGSAKHEKDLGTHQRQFLEKIGQRLPDLWVTQLEYAIDIFPAGDCYTVRSLFNLLRRYLFVPHARKFSVSGGQDDNRMIEVRGAIKMSRVLRANSLKLYERGNDGKRDHEVRGWHFEDFNRLRLERTFIRENLLKLGIVTLDDLIEDPRFRKVFRGKLHFFQAKKSSRNLPAPCDPYLSFQEEFWGVRDANGRGYYQEREREDRLDELVQAIHELTDWFDRRWRGEDVQRPFLFGERLCLIQ